MGKKYKINYAQLCDLFLAPLYKLIFWKECLRLIEVVTLIRSIGSWYLKEDHTYLRIYGVIDPSLVA
jgi:hypothetical protein